MLFEGLTIGCVLWSALGTVIGIIFGSLPGLTATMGVALMLPFTFSMDIYQSMALLLGIYCGGTYGGSITAILLRTPGTPASAATALDGYPLNKQGKATQALDMALSSSFVGGIISCALLVFIAPQLSKIAIQFGPAEYFAVGLFGLSMIGGISGKSVFKSLFGAMFGLWIATIGGDAFTGTLRFHYNTVGLASGINTVPALIGLFAIAEVFNKLENLDREERISVDSNVGGRHLKLKEYKPYAGNILRSSLMGTIVGIIPATGSVIASWLGYNFAKKSSKHPEEFGHGSLEGIAASEASNNGVTGGALVPLLTLGVPGDVVTAVMLGAFTIQGITPGPTLFTEDRAVVTGIYVLLLLANVFMLIFGRLGIKAFINVLKVPNEILMPAVLMLCFVGAYSLNKNMTDVIVALVFGIIGYLCNKVDIATPPILLGIILGRIVEINFRRALTISRNDYFAAFVENPIALAFLVISALSFLWPVLTKMLKKLRNKA